MLFLGGLENQKKIPNKIKRNIKKKFYEELKKENKRH